MTGRTSAIRVCHVITGLNTGGAEMFLCRLLETLRPPEFEHTVVCLLAEGPLSKRVAAVAEVYHLGMQRSRLGVAALWRLRRTLRGARPDLVHGWMYHADLMATLAGLGCGVPIIWGIRQSLYELKGEKPVTRLVIRGCSLLSRLPARIIYNSKLGADQHTEFGFSSRRTSVISNGFDTGMYAPDPMLRDHVRTELGIADDAIAIGLVARVHPMKDHPNFLRAAAQFIEKWPQSVFILVGDGADSSNAELTELIEQLHLESRIRLCGRRTDIAAVDNALDIASSSSSWGEGFSNAVAEAMACGTPCVATDVGDTREIIADTGITVQPGDSDALCAGWEHLAKLGEAGRRELGMRARQRIIEHYSLAAVAHRYADLYLSLSEKH